MVIKSLLTNSLLLPSTHAQRVYHGTHCENIQYIFDSHTYRQSTYIWLAQNVSV